MNPILLLLQLVPVTTSLILGLVYLVAGESRPGLKIFVASLILVAVWLQFFSRLALLGLLVQTAVALGLAVWRKANAT